MSVVSGLPLQSDLSIRMMHKNSFQWRNDSGELDVFEAAQYFSGDNENLGGVNFGQNFMIRSATRMSLDIPKRSPFPANHHQNQAMQKQVEIKKYKQPSSPGARLAGFLNSLFNQKVVTKKKKSKSVLMDRDLEEDQNPGGLRRKRRSSIGSFPTAPASVTKSFTDSKSVSSSSSSGFATPHPFRFHHVISLPKSSESFDPRAVKNDRWNDEGRGFTERSGGKDEKPGLRNGIQAKIFLKNVGFNEFANDGKHSDSRMNCHDPSEEKGFRKFSDGDEGGDSDSSSDLFDLPNLDSGFFAAADLPVHETTKCAASRKFTSSLYFV